METDACLVTLSERMADIWSFVEETASVKAKIQRLDNVIEKALNQTIRCAIFIREYTGHGFVGKSSLSLPLDSVNSSIERLVRLPLSNSNSTLQGLLQGLET